ncbi:hypothetical protein CDCA_CDCA18G4601 [Cyanidium caldarium]|uniref:Assimilatory sulfite reductase (ferredoxin) n=1 Tax=Cyanidium caldarium TaxID=2771 RepID=A0AAV9J2E1_CYACA|nr:hypothetical protein CDCA_CDCA18G4601 [Cyanidium caldarium]
MVQQPPVRKTVPISTLRELLEQQRNGTLKRLRMNPYEVPKLHSNYLRHPLAEDLADDNIFISDDSIGLIKFHGGYQQDDRDQRVRGELKKYQFMLRMKMPAGECPAKVFQAIDDVSEMFGNHTLRLTSRSSFQIHGILKSNLKAVYQKIIHAGGGLYGASGDCSRNVSTCAAPFTSAPYRHARHTAKMLAEVLGLQSRAFAEIWLDGEKAATIETWKEDIDMDDVQRIIRHDNGRGAVLDDPVEPIYGHAYLPRKFKMGVTVPGDNSLDVYTHDVALVVMCDSDGNLEGYDVLVGGGMGRAHGKEETFARAADHFGYVPAHAVYDLVKAIAATQRDHGNREVRTNARMKYLVHRMGVDAFRDLVKTYMEDGGAALEPFRPLPPWRFSDWLGWHEDGSGTWFLGLYVQNGRLKGEYKRALRQVANQFGYTFVTTPQQNVLIAGVPTEKKRELESLLQSHGVELDAERLDPLMRNAMACPALPLCPPATTEAERVMPAYVQRVRQLMNKVGISDRESFVLRMTGCPNGCTRPYMAELGFVGSGPNCTYQLWLGVVRTRLV